MIIYNVTMKIFTSFIEKMTSNDTDDVIEGIVNDLTRNAKTTVNVN